MSDLTRTLALSASGMQAQSSRLRHVSENVANADTPGYRRKTIPFEPARLAGDRWGQTSGVAAGPMALDPRELPRIY
ncbi:MAG TPA: flagellar basal body rod protein FlgC, partial [Paracoccus sp.]|nr:flagellar basal body rod protein FlgC [Paracoccus sp. (in: a-proteobacteria)]